eukprot:6490830-Amphidinium_carterae.2
MPANAPRSRTSTCGAAAMQGVQIEWIVGARQLRGGGDPLSLRNQNAPKHRLNMRVVVHWLPLHLEPIHSPAAVPLRLDVAT